MSVGVLHHLQETLQCLYDTDDALTGEQLYKCSWFGEFSWLPAGADLSSDFLLATEVEEEPCPAGFLRLLFIPAENKNMDNKDSTIRAFQGVYENH